MDPSAISPSGEGPLHQALRAELEASRQAFHALLATLAPADWTRPSLNPAWTIGEVLWHIAGYLFLIPQQLVWLQTGTFPDQSQRSADELNRGNVQQTRAGAKAQTLISIAQAYEEGHALTLAALRRVRDDEWPIGVRMADMGPTFTGEYRTIETLFRYHARHFAEHAAQIPRGSIPMNEAEYVAGNPPFTGTDGMVVVSGCSGAGKSTLLAELALRGYLVHPEPGRQIVKEQLHLGGDGLPWENPLKFAELCVSRALFFYNTAMPIGKPAIFDRSIVDNIAGIERLGLPLPHYLSVALQRYRYARRVFMTPPWKELFSADAERRHSFGDAEAEFAGLLKSYAANGYEVVLIPKGTPAERASFLERQLGF